MSADHPWVSKKKSGFRSTPICERQKTLDDEERVLPPQNRDRVMSPNEVTPRSTIALETYERIQRMKETEIDPLFP